MEFSFASRCIRKRELQMPVLGIYVSLLNLRDVLIGFQETFRYRVHKNLPFVRIPRQIILIHALRNDFFRIHFNIIIPSMP